MNQVTAAVRTRLLPIALAQFVGLVCGVVGVKLHSQLVAPADYGLYGLFLTFTPLGVLVVHAGLLKFTARHWAAAQDRDVLWKKIIGVAGRKLPWLLASAIAAAALLMGVRWYVIVPFIFISATALSFGSLAQTALQADQRHWSDFGTGLGSSPTRSFLPPLFYWMTGGASLSLYTGFTFHALGFALLAFLFLRPSLKTASANAIETRLGDTYAGSMFNVLAVASWTLTGITRWIVALFFGVTTTGYFTLANNVAMVIPMVLGGAFTQFFQPEFFAAPHETAHDRARLARRVDKVAATFCVLAVAGLLLLRAAMPWLVGTLVAEQYAEATAFILPAGCFFVAVVTSQFYHQLLLAAHKESACVPVDLTFAGVLVAGSLIAAQFGMDALCGWLTATLLIPWMVSRPLARHYLNKSTTA
jgi:O-antigen/teichoic acid export membrane protein